MMPSSKFVQNEASFKKIEPRFLPLIFQAKQVYRSYFGEQLLAAYLVGSVARGNFIDGISDCDFESVISRGVTHDDWRYLHKSSDQIRKNYSWLPKLDFEVISIADLPNRPVKQFTLATEGLLLEGELIKLAQAPPIGPKLAHLLNKTFVGRLDRAQKVLTEPDLSQAYLADRTRWLVKIILRLALGLVMIRSGQYVHAIDDIPHLVEKELPELAEMVSLLKKYRYQPEGTRGQYEELLEQAKELYRLAKAAGIAD